MNTVPDALELPLEKAKAFTTSEINQLLWNKFTDRGEHILLFDVPDVIGFNSKRRCDAIAVGMWQSSRREIQGFEVKASRSDWLRELKMVDKADPFIERCDRWWLVTGSASIAKPEEIPACWGWMSATKTGLRVQKPAPSLREERPAMERLWAFALIRRAAEKDGEVISRMRDEIRAEYARYSAQEIARATREVEPRLKELQEKIAKFETDSGMRMGDWRLGNVGKLARLIHDISDDGYNGFRKRLQQHVHELDVLKDRTVAALAALGDPSLPTPEEPP